ncbi:hypothetical protein H310_10355 [Aphanomyces invadans]|uniref:Uncharacterized protein n=1 Tax=Aphanomyces invadans TaxID=157072 RepID=A0A024TRN9_9STRA|nr:hypothetical protein H310_10350 [Aphanomyces invadans]XP_008874943.1 hypothetical protein H310_10355 [Aphanomyces invadans]ETV96674.1 hypothetical protein H310_10350 [Aphanomyces invadans]ETV96680.1 hypothetical protein H310_10355 [Aphanomyces invadans]|eukprot:XP_008874937.1 hypothetical protein H310_10350 [Aphanomyces invadans]
MDKKRASSVSAATPTVAFAMSDSTMANDADNIVKYIDTELTIIQDDIPTLTGEQTTDTNGIPLYKWRTSLFAFSSFNLSLSLLSVVAPCVPVGHIAQRVGLGQFVLVLVVAGVFYVASFGLSFLQRPLVNAIATACSLNFIGFLAVLRSRVRQLFDIPGSLLSDTCTVMWCGCCAIAQMSTHVEAMDTRSCCSLVPRDVLPGYK